MLSNSRDVVPCHVIVATDGRRPGQEEEIGSVRGEERRDRGSGLLWLGHTQNWGLRRSGELSF